MENLFIHVVFSGALMLLVAWTGLFKAKAELEEALGEKVRIEKSILIGTLSGAGILGIAAYAFNAGLPAVLIISGAMVYPCGSIMRALAFRVGIGLSALVVLSRLFGLNTSSWIMVIVLAIIPGIAYLIGKYLEPTFDGWR